MLRQLQEAGTLSRVVFGKRFAAAPKGTRWISGVNDLTTIRVHISSAMSGKAGSLMPVLETFNKYGLSLTHMESQLHQYSYGDAQFEFDVDSDPDCKATEMSINELREHPQVARVEKIEPRAVPWFPTSLKDLDEARSTLDGGTALINEDHPGFNDQGYKHRRNRITENAKAHHYGQSIPIVDYTENEHKTWGLVYNKLQSLQKDHACDDFLSAMAKFNRYGVLTADRIPQLQEVSELLHASTGFQIRPVSGLLTARDFLNALAFRTFWSTQYIRHESNPFYTPEPDCCHELLGHVPLFAHKDFAEFSQTIGLASLGATDQQIDRLATLYWFTVEFGVLDTPKGYKAYGAGILSSFGELEWACSENPSDEARVMGGLPAYEKFKDLQRPQVSPLNADITSTTAFPITTYQPLYFASPTLLDAKQEVMRFCDTLSRPFFCSYDPFSQRIKVTRSIQRQDRTTTADMQAEKQADFFGSLVRVDSTAGAL